MSTRQAAERLVWTVDLLAIERDDQVLEIGCGHGVAVSLVCDRLGAGGCITAIDRSPKMISMAARRNADHVAAGVARFQTTSLHEADFGDAQFDKIFAVHVGVFLRGRPARELDVVKAHLAPGGTFTVVDQPLAADSAEPTANKLAATLGDHRLLVRDVVIDDLSATRVLAVVAECPSTAAASSAPDVPAPP